MNLKTFICCALISLAPLVAISGDFPSGKYLVELGDSPFTINISNDNSYVVERNDQVISTGIMKVSNDTLTVTDNPSDHSCPSPGSYLWRYEDEKLSFTSISDDCEGRADVMLAGNWILLEN